MIFASIPLAFVAFRVIADESWPITFWVDAHPPNLVRVLAFESLRLTNLELAQQSLKALIAMDGFLHLHETINKNYELISVLITIKY